MASAPLAWALGWSQEETEGEVRVGGSVGEHASLECSSSPSTQCPGEQNPSTRVWRPHTEDCLLTWWKARSFLTATQAGVGGGGREGR